MNFFLWTPCLSDDSFQAIFSSLLTTILVSAQFPWASLWPPGTHLPCLPIHELVVVHELGFPLTQRLASLSLSSTSSWTLSLADLPVSNGLSWRGNFLITGKIFCVSILDTASLRAVSLAWTSLKWFQDVLSWLSSMTEIHLAGFLAARPCIGLSQTRHPDTCPGCLLKLLGVAFLVGLSSLRLPLPWSL